jgi:large subunit ribosomal protein L7/L12
MAEKITKAEVIEFISNMTVLELSELVKELEDTFGVKASAPVMAMAGPMPGAGEVAVQEEQTEFAVILTGVGEKKIQVIKEVRAITNLGLKEAKDAVETLPSTIKEGIPKEEAENVKKQLEGAGATVEIK